MLIGSILNHSAILLTGAILGVGTVGLNVMISDPGTNRHTRAATVGIITASASLLVGGIVGCYCQTWMALLPGVALQAIALLMLPWK